jgi:hypothetical protein
MTRDEAIAACEAASGMLWQAAAGNRLVMDREKLRSQSLLLGDVARYLTESKP